MKLPQGNLYVTANRNGDDIIRETFVTLGKSGGDEKADAEALGRLVSLFLQHGGDVKEVIHSLKESKEETSPGTTDSSFFPFLMPWPRLLRTSAGLRWSLSPSSSIAPTVARAR